MDKCRECGKSLTESDCYPSDRKKNWCKDCRKAWRRKWRAKYKEEHGEDDGKRWRTDNKPKMRSLKDKYREQKIDLVNSLKGNPCVDCGNKYPAVCMDFDHVGTDKDRNVAILVNGGYGKERILTRLKSVNLFVQIATV